MSKKLYSIINNILFITFVITSLYALFNTYLARKDLPPGICPVDNSRPLLYLAIATGVLSFVFSLLKKPLTAKSNEHH